MSFDLYHGDCLEVLKTIPENSIDSIVTDPPYELSNDGKQSAAGVFLEFAFPQNAKIEAKCESGNCLSFLVDEILGLGAVRSIPSPSSAVPVVSVALNGNTPLGKHDVEHDSECSVGVSKDAPAGDVEAQGVKHLGCFALKLTDRTKALQVLNKVGAGFVSRGVGVGFGVHSASHPGALHGLASVVSVDDVVGLRYGSLSDLIGALAGAAASPVFCLDLRRGAIEEFSANSARLFASILLLAGAELVRADAATGCLPAMFEARRVCVVDDSANGAFTFDLIVHEQIIASNGFMGKEWDGSKIAFNVELWAECLRVLKPGGHLLAFSGTRTQHRMVCAIEDAGFEIRDMIAWVYGSGFPKSLDVSKAIDKMDAAEEQERRRLTFTAWVRSQGVTSRQIDEATGTNMGGHYTTAASQPAIMTREHLEACRHLFREVPQWVEQEADIRSVESRNMASREVLCRSENGIAGGSGKHAGQDAAYGFGAAFDITVPATEAARQWQGWGTALKPALEPITVARKPLVGTVAANVLEHGTGALNIDGCRVHSHDSEGYAYTVQRMMPGAGQNATGKTHQEGVEFQGQTKDGRWPANLILSYNEDEFELRPGVTAEQKKELLKFLYENT